MTSVHDIWHVARPQVRNVVRSRWLVCYLVFFILITEGLLRFAGGGPAALLSLANVVLFVVPLVTLVYGTIYLYNSREFIELLLAQPLKRRTVYTGLYAGLMIPLVVALVAGVAIPFIYHGVGESQRFALAILLCGAAALTAVFTGIAFCVALRFDDKLTGLGAGLAIWLVLALVYDGALLFAVALADRPMEKTHLASALANPIDLVRIAMLLQFDVSALMGYTGAIFQRFFSAGTGGAVIVAALAAWITIPLAGGYLAFRRKDF
jgi:Cu-processing system permease protein